MQKTDFFLARDNNNYNRILNRLSIMFSSKPITFSKEARVFLQIFDWK